MKKIVALVLGEILHLANRDIPSNYKEEFYQVKNKIISRYGIKIGQDIQHIKKECWSCDGTGKFRSSWKLPEDCWSCEGTGIYKEEWNRLDKYQVGRHDFHQPIERMRRYYPLFDGESKNHIEGYIRHSKPKYRLGLELAYWLLIFEGHNPKLRGFMIPKPRTPLLIFVALRWRIRMIKLRIKNKAICCSESAGYRVEHFEHDLTDLPF